MLIIRAAIFWAIFFPVQLFLSTLLLATELLRCLRLAIRGAWSRLGHKARPVEPSWRPEPDRLCSIVVLNWNGRHLLNKSLPPLLEAVLADGRPHEILVVDNGSQDESTQWLSEHFPQVRVLALPENLGFGEGNNAGVRAARNDVVVLLNNDMIVDRQFLGPLLQALRGDVFAVSSQVFFPEDKRREETGNTQARLKRGYLHLSHEALSKGHWTRKYLPILWAGGGASAYRRDRFLQLGGFSQIYAPCYLEDTDLSYRAWRRGWPSLLAAESRVLHLHRSSSRARFSTRAIRELTEERKLYYLWRNLQLRTLMEHLLLFPCHLGRHLSIETYLRALARIPWVLWLRLGEPRRVFSDREILTWPIHPLHYLNRFSMDRTTRAPNFQGRLRILIISAYLPHLGHHGGAGRVFQLLKRTAQRHLVTLVTFVESDHELELAEQVRPFCDRMITVVRGGISPVSPFPYEPFEEFNSPDLRAVVEELLLEQDFDRVHFEWTQMAQLADLAPHVPKLLTEIEVNYAAHLTRVRIERNPLRKARLYYNGLQTLYRELELCRGVDRVICVTDTDREFLRGYLPDQKLVTVNTGVDTRYFSPEVPERIDADSLVFVGAFRHEPNVDAMLHFCLQILPIIRKKRPQIRLWIVGSSPPPEIRELDRIGNVVVTGFVDDIRQYYWRAQAVVVPLRSGVGIRGKILEAWACGKATVATPLACLGIQARDQVNILIAEQAEDFALATLRLLEDPELAARLGREARRTAVESYEWDLPARKLLRFYEELPSCGP